MQLRRSSGRLLGAGASACGLLRPGRVPVDSGGRRPAAARRRWHRRSRTLGHASSRWPRKPWSSLRRSSGVLEVPEVFYKHINIELVIVNVFKHTYIYIYIRFLHIHFFCQKVVNVQELKRQKSLTHIGRKAYPRLFTLVKIWFCPPYFNCINLLLS